MYICSSLHKIGNSLSMYTSRSCVILIDLWILFNQNQAREIIYWKALSEVFVKALRYKYLFSCCLCSVYWALPFHSWTGCCVERNHWKVLIFAFISLSDHKCWCLLTKNVFINGNQSVLNRFSTSGLNLLGLVLDNLPQLRLGKIIKNQASLGLNH